MAAKSVEYSRRLVIMGAERAGYECRQVITQAEVVVVVCRSLVIMSVTCIDNEQYVI